MINTEYCYYKESMLLKKLGYNEGCDSFYEDLVTHNGEAISFEEELDLKNEGRGKEIKREHGGSVGLDYNQNSTFFMRNSFCSRPTLSQALRWLRETRHWHIEACPSNEDRWHVWIVCLNGRDPEDGKLVACDLEGKEFPTYETALHSALLFQLTCLNRVNNIILKRLKEEENGKGKRN